VDSQLGLKSWDVTALVQGYWLGRAFGASPNFGLELRGPETGSFYLRSFYASEAKQYRPYLIVSYSLPLEAVGDAYVSEVQPATNFGSATKLSVQNADGELADDRRSYLGFDLSAIPPRL